MLTESKFVINDKFNNVKLVQPGVTIRISTGMNSIRFAIRDDMHSTTLIRFVVCEDTARIYGGKSFADGQRFRMDRSLAVEVANAASPQLAYARGIIGVRDALKGVLRYFDPPIFTSDRESAEKVKEDIKMLDGYISTLPYLKRK
ncbi:MAG: hypothetical protein ACREBF_02745 [Candidatus Micrarchaeales archaeon]